MTLKVDENSEFDTNLIGSAIVKHHVKSPDPPRQAILLHLQRLRAKRCLSIPTRHDLFRPFIFRPNLALGPESTSWWGGAISAPGSNEEQHEDIWVRSNFLFL